MAQAVAASPPTRDRKKARRAGKEVSTPLYRIEQKPNCDYTKLPHDGYVYALVTGGPLLAECKKLIADRKRVLKERDEYFKFMSQYFGIPVVGNYGHSGWISDLALEIPLPEHLRAFDWSKQTRKQYDAYKREREDFRKKYTKPFYDGEFGPWRIDECYFSSPLSDELREKERSTDTVLRLRVKPHRNKAGGRAEYMNLEALRMPQPCDLAARISPNRHQWVSRGPAPRGGIYMSNPGMMTLGKHFILRLPISELKPQPKTLFLDMGEAKRLTMSEYWQLREKVGE